MAFSYTVDTIQTTGLCANDSMIRPGMALATGTATAGGDGNGEIVTGLSDLLFYVLINNEAQDEAPQSAPNVDGSGSASLGSIGLLNNADDTNNTYIWAAFGVV